MPKPALNLAEIPPVTQILEHPCLKSCVDELSHELVLAIVQNELQRLREKVLAGEAKTKARVVLTEEIAQRAEKKINDLMTPSLKPVINGTGVVLHTGLGRAPLTPEAQENLMKIASGYSALEFDLESGGRGDRGAHVEETLCHLTGAEAACVVNNNAAAVLLVLNTLAFGKEAIISRGQLIEIGGSFRMPDVMKKSGVDMVEVGTTNKTHLKDYKNAVSDRTGLICVVHTSNYRVKGFTKEVELPQIVALGNEVKVPVFQDLGGGVLIDLQKFGLPYEPVVKDSIASGVDLVSFSGDKVLGGPQSGIIVGKRQYLDRIKSNPLMRALRCDKLIYAALEPTLKRFLHQNGVLEHSVLKMLLQPVEQLEKRATKILKKLGPEVQRGCQICVEDTCVQAGSGTLPLEELPSKALSIAPKSQSADALARKFRYHQPPVIGYIRDDKLYFDLKTIFDFQDQAVIDAIHAVVSDTIG